MVRPAQIDVFSFNINLYELLSIIDTCTGGFIVMSSYMLSICDTFDA